MLHENVQLFYSGDERKAVAAMINHLDEVLQRLNILVKDYLDYFI